MAVVHIRAQFTKKPMWMAPPGALQSYTEMLIRTRGLAEEGGREARLTCLPVGWQRREKHLLRTV